METQSALAPLKANDYKSWLKPVWCPGCGDFSVLSAITKALAEMRLAPEMVGLVTGIGCSSRLPGYTSLYGFHGVHGRALPIATGLKAARPDITVLAAGGDGDGFSIGGNHFLHACRRNLDLTYIVMDNSVYGMTKGQASPTTEPDWTKSKLTPEGTGVPPFRPLEMALSAGATYVARGFAGKPNDLAKLIVDGIKHPGFSFIHVLSPCVTFRPEQKDYKHKVHEGFGEEPTNDRREAFVRLMDDDGFMLGALFEDDSRAFKPGHEATAKMADIEAQFAL